MKEDDDDVKPVVIENPSLKKTSEDGMKGPAVKDQENVGAADKSVLKYTSATF